MEPQFLLVDENEQLYGSGAGPVELLDDAETAGGAGAGAATGFGAAAEAEGCGRTLVPKWSASSRCG